MDENTLTAERLRRFLVEVLEADPKDVATDDAPLISSQVIDSLGFMQIVSFLEGEFQVEVADDEMVKGNFETIRAIARLVDSKLG